MDRSELSAVIVHEAAELLAEELHRIVCELMQHDLDTMERALQQVSRRVFGQVLSNLVRMKGEDVARPVVCPTCTGPLRLIGNRRTKHRRGLVGDLILQRATYVCTVCHQGHSPLDTELGMGSWGLTPGLARVAALAGITDAFADAAALLQEMRGVQLSTEHLRTLSEAMGAVAEAEQQEGIVAVRAGHLHESAAGSETLLVEVDGVHVPEIDGWHEMKIVRAAPLGPQRRTDPQTGRTSLCLGASICGGGVEGAEPFWARVQRVALQAGLGDRTRRVVVLCDGALWIWARATSFLCGPQREVIEIVDIFHAYEHLWAVGHALYPDERVCRRWVETLKDALYTQGAAAVLDALTAATPQTAEARDLVQVTQDYFVSNAARMDYPRFVAAELPIGSGAIESLCKNLVEERAKGAGMRWTEAGVQRIISLRALHRSGQWTSFWARHPLTGYARRWPRKQRPYALASAHTPHSDPSAEAPPVVTPPERPVPHPPHPSPWRRGPGVLPRCA